MSLVYEKTKLVNSYYTEIRITFFLVHLKDNIKKNKLINKDGPKILFRLCECALVFVAP